ncbi:MAG: tRNA (5-methylaminomethyl-2-thiouridine)(34)-methyltransferase MnmD [Chitinophagaceae bacterium]
MDREIILTEDGSHTVSVPEMNVTYHSVHGAIQESMHVFIDAGFRQFSDQAELRIFEMGFGTGLNALLTLIEAEKTKQQIDYTSIELFPLQAKEIGKLNYCGQLNCKDLEPVFTQLHQCDWEKEIQITEHFTLQKLNTSLSAFNPSTLQPFHLIYYDAFAPSAQPELWTTEIFEKLYNLLNNKGALVTYCSKGGVRRAMKAAGFAIEKIPGPPYKREMVRARKNEK